MPVELTSATDTVVIVGGGFTGSLLALKLAAQGVLQPVLIEPSRHAGPGLAYGAAGAEHLLNVPVHRMEVGLSPTFADWLANFPEVTGPAVAEAGDLAQGFVSRRLFGEYLKGQVEAAKAAGCVTRLKAEVTGLRKATDGRAKYTLALSDGRHVAANRVVLATGNFAPQSLNLRTAEGGELVDAAFHMSDPWAPEALADLHSDAPVLLIGTGLTMADMVLSLHAQGHRGKIYALSRRGLLPLPHKSGGAWPFKIVPGRHGSPLIVLREVRRQIAEAATAGVPWQRVLDAVRPVVAHIWAGRNRAERTQFLRHLRPFWDVHRHRVAPRVHAVIRGMTDIGQLIPLKGRVTGISHAENVATVLYRGRHGDVTRSVRVVRVINCTGPRTDYASIGSPLFADLREQGLSARIGWDLVWKPTMHA